ncbi:MAG: NTP transferase domain-containing protein, partial [Dysgonamonadaceae bacterium]|nr:NTP transferase domain-containing protein [Dysgonamonadaceae bacterium]
MKEALILAGGMGTRLRSVVSDIPKCMAPVAGQPFLHYLLTTLESAGFDHIILSLGYKYEVVEEYVHEKEWKMTITSV